MAYVKRNLVGNIVAVVYVVLLSVLLFQLSLAAAC